jgi:hypothetical protein
MRLDKKGILQAKGAILAQFLNIADGLAKQKRVSGLLERYRELQNLLPAVVSGRPLGQVRGGPRAGALAYDLRENKRAARLVRQINRLLARYRFRRLVPITLLVGRDETPRIETETYAAHAAPFSRIEMTRGSTVDEYGAVEQVLDLAEAGELDCVRKCRFCEKWFMANRSDHIYHEACAAKQHRKDRKDSGIANEYMKWYRKYAPFKLRKRQLEEKQEDGYHLSKSERAELRQATEETEHLKSEWKSTLNKLKGESE